MTRRRILAAVSAAVLAGVGILAATGVIGPQSIDVCVQVYEDQSAGGDTFATCNTSPANVKVPNLDAITTGLHNGCNRGINQSSTWNDCISSANIGHLPANQSVRFYQNVSYSSQILCYDVDGSHLVQLNVPDTNDKASSFRIVGGNC